MSAPADILILLGSPRPDGNCATLATRFISEASDAGLSTHLAAPFSAGAIAARQTSLTTPSFHTNIERISACVACHDCSDDAMCIIADEAIPVLEAALKAKAILWISPLYFASVPSQLKKLIDRTQMLFERRKLGLAKHKQERKPAYTLIVGGGGDPFGFEAAMPPIASASRMMEAELDKSVVVIGADAPGEIDDERFKEHRVSIERLFAQIIERVLEER